MQHSNGNGSLGPTAGRDRVLPLEPRFQYERGRGGVTYRRIHYEQISHATPHTFNSCCYRFLAIHSGAKLLQGNGLPCTPVVHQRTGGLAGCTAERGELCYSAVRWVPTSSVA